MSATQNKRKFLLSLISLINIIELSMCMICAIFLDWYVIKIPFPNQAKVHQHREYYNEFYGLFSFTKQWGTYTNITKETTLYIQSYYYFYSTVFNVVGLHQILAFICLIMVFTSGVMIYQNYGTRAVHKFNVLFSIMMLTFQSFSLFYFLRITDAFNNENIGGCNGKYWCHTFNGTKEGKTWGPGIGFWISVNSFSGSILNLILSIIQYYSTRNMDRPSPPSHLEYPTIEFINSIDSIKNYHNNLIYNDMTNQSNGNNYTYKSSSSIQKTFIPANYILENNDTNPTMILTDNSNCIDNV